LEIVMRVYFEKPRTTIGWKGLINDPHLDDSYDIEEGLKIARRLLLDITSQGLPTATEFLDPVIPQYIADLISWAAIGARTTELRHRKCAGIRGAVGKARPACCANGRLQPCQFRQATCASGRSLAQRHPATGGGKWRAHRGDG